MGRPGGIGFGNVTSVAYLCAIACTGLAIAGCGGSNDGEASSSSTGADLTT